MVNGNAFGRGFNFNTVSTRSCTPNGCEVLLKTASGKPALSRRKVGDGQVFLLGFCVQDTYFQTWEDKDAAARADLRGLISGRHHLMQYSLTRLVVQPRN